MELQTRLSVKKSNKCTKTPSIYWQGERYSFLYLLVFLLWRLFTTAKEQNTVYLSVFRMPKANQVGRKRHQPTGKKTPSISVPAGLPAVKALHDGDVNVRIAVQRLLLWLKQKL
jgi:hypothetical protein